MTKSVTAHHHPIRRPGMPGSGNEGEDRYLEMAMADADLGSEIVLSRLGKHVQAHYEELIEVGFFYVGWVV